MGIEILIVIQQLQKMFFTVIRTWFDFIWYYSLPHWHIFFEFDDKHEIATVQSSKVYQEFNLRKKWKELDNLKELKFYLNLKSELIYYKSEILVW
jgi:hypothetical protein